MLSPYSPLDFMEALASERRAVPRILTAGGDAIATRMTLRRRVGRSLVRFGQWLDGGAALPDVARA